MEKPGWYRRSTDQHPGIGGQQHAENCRPCDKEAGCNPDKLMKDVEKALVTPRTFSGDNQPNQPKKGTFIDKLLHRDPTPRKP